VERGLQHRESALQYWERTLQYRERGPQYRERTLQRREWTFQYKDRTLLNDRGMKMPLLSKEDLHYKDYSWMVYQEDDPKVTGEPDSSLLHRKEGYEVLYLINKFAEKHKFKRKESGRRAERLIRESLPGEIRSQEEVMKWLAQNWQSK